MAHPPLREALARLDRWCQAGDGLPEKALEAFLLLEVFRESLGYSSRDAVPQVGADKNRTGVADLALKVNRKNRSKWIVVEIKRPTRELADRAIQQAASYLISLGASRGIVTNGRTWLFLRTQAKPRARRRYRADILLRVDLGQAKSRQRRLLEGTFGRCGKSTIGNLFSMREALRDLGPDGINAAIGRVTRPNWPRAIHRAIPAKERRQIARRDLGALRLGCQDIATLRGCLLGAYNRVPMTGTG